MKFHFIYVSYIFPSLRELSCATHQGKHQSVIKRFPFLYLLRGPTPAHSNFEQALKFISSLSILIADFSHQNQHKVSKCLSLLTRFPAQVSLFSHPSLSSEVFLKPPFDHVSLEWLLSAYRMHVLLSRLRSSDQTPLPLSTPLPTCLSSLVMPH